MAKAGGYRHEMNLEYYKSRVSRLQALQAQVTSIMGKQTSEDVDRLGGLLRDIYSETYYRNVYTTQQAKGAFSANFARVDESKLDAIIHSGWSGANFSQRLWGNATKELPKVLSESLFRGIALGYGSERLVKMARLKLQDFSKYQVHRLVLTETAHITEVATLNSYKESGVEKVEWLATLESHTCDVCGALDGKVFEIGKLEAPPRHPYCRCTIVPVTSFDSRIDELFAGIDNKRWARNPKTGKGQVIQDMSFGDWKKEVDKKQAAWANVDKLAKKNLKENGTIKPKVSPVEKSKELLPGVRKGKPMSVEKADSHNANPNFLGGNFNLHDEYKRLVEINNQNPTAENYKKAQEAQEAFQKMSKKYKAFGINCQRCVPSYELRRRGYDVEAVANPALKRMTKQDKYLKPGETMEEAFERLYREKKMDRFAMNTNQVWLDVNGEVPPLLDLDFYNADSFEKAIESIVNDNERYSIQWAWNGRGAGGHIVNLERVNGEIKFIDNQVGKVSSLGEFVEKTVSNAKSQSFKYLRIDDKKINPDYIEQLVKGKSS